MSEARPSRGRPRRADVDDRILEAAGALLRERGPGAVHVDAVATRSGVARTTIYRRYSGRRDLLAAALARVTDSGPVPVGPDVQEKLRQVLERVRAVIDTGVGRGGVAAVITDADPEFTQALRAALSGLLEPLMLAMSADAEQGLLREDVDPDALMNLAFGSYLGELLRYGEERADWLDRTAVLLEHAARG